MQFLPWISWTSWLAKYTSGLALLTYRELVTLGQFYHKKRPGWSHLLSLCSSHRNKYFPSNLEELYNDIGICKVCRIANEIKTGKFRGHYEVFDLQKFWYEQNDDNNSICQPVRGKDYDIWKNRSRIRGVNA